MYLKRPSPSNASCNLSIVARWILLLAIAVGGSTSLVTAFRSTLPLRAGRNWVTYRSPSRLQDVESRKSVLLELVNNTVVKVQESNDLFNDTLSQDFLNTTDQNESWINRLSSHPIFQQKSIVPLSSPPPRIEDADLLFFDVFLLLNLSLAISYCVVYRMSVVHLSSAFGEGSLLCILWIISGLYHGSFLYSAVDGHLRPGDKMSGPTAACMLALHTFVSTINLRLVVALAIAILEHRAVGASPSEQLMPLEAGFGLLLMSVWRFLHSAFSPRV